MTLVHKFHLAITAFEYWNALEHFHNTTIFTPFIFYSVYIFSCWFFCICFEFFDFWLIMTNRLLHRSSNDLSHTELKKHAEGACARWWRWHFIKRCRHTRAYAFQYIKHTVFIRARARSHSYTHFADTGSTHVACLCLFSFALLR